MNNLYTKDSIESLSAREHTRQTVHKNTKYLPGNIIGKYGVYFLEELPPKIYPNGRKRRRGKFICPICGNIFECSVEQITQKRATKSCGCLHNEQVKKMGQNNVKDITGFRSGKLIAIEKTLKKASDNSFIWKCKCDCGNISYVPISEIVCQRIQSCGCSKESHGERKIRTILENSNISFKQEYSFKNLKNPLTNQPLRFDFYLPEQNICIEYDGEQHFKELDAHYFFEDLTTIQARDNIKNKYCTENNIILIRIPYTDYKRISKKYLEDQGVYFG